VGGEKRGVGKKPYGSSVYGGEKRGCELARVQRLLGEKIKMAVAKRVAGQELIQGGAVKGVAKTPGLFDVALDGGVRLKGDFDTGEGAETVEECGVEKKAEGSEGLEFEWVVGIVSGQHSRGGCRGFREGRGTVEHGDGHAAVVEFKGEGEADDTGSSDTDIGVVHALSLERDQSMCVFPLN
jgi:hypothetical protein